MDVNIDLGVFDGSMQMYLAGRHNRMQLVSEMHDGKCSFHLDK